MFQYKKLNQKISVLAGALLSMISENQLVVEAIVSLQFSSSCLALRGNATYIKNIKNH